MIASLAGVWKPEYLLQPGRLLRRVLGRERAANDRGMFVLPLPWGVSLEVRRLDEIAKTVDRFGVYDLVVTEAIWRLAQPGDTVIDAGANVGFMSLAIIARLGRAGRLFAFEPHPDLFGELTANLDAARVRFPGVEVHAIREALSDVAGTACLSMPEAFGENRGLASLAKGGAGIDVTASRLDDHAGEMGSAISLMKIDVEGHEAAAFRGARGLFERGAIEHVILEEHARLPTEATALLQGFGYTIFSLERALMGPRLGDPLRPRRSGWEAPSLLATRRPEVVRAAFAPMGWRALGA